MQAASSGGGGSIRSEKRFYKFTLMLKMHIPMGAVAAKLRSVGCSPAEITAFENDAAAPPQVCWNGTKYWVQLHEIPVLRGKTWR